MKLEVPNKDYKNTYWLATIVAKATPLILVRYEGFQDNNEEDFWCNTLSDDIHPVGWCSRSQHALKPPKGDVPSNNSCLFHYTPWFKLPCVREYPRSQLVLVSTT